MGEKVLLTPNYLKNKNKNRHKKLPGAFRQQKIKNILLIQNYIKFQKESETTKT